MIPRWQKPFLFALAVSLSALFAIAQQPLIQRSAPRFQGGGWAEQIQCLIPVKPGERLILRADPGAVNVSAGAANQVRCVILLRSYNRDPQEARTCLDRYRLTAVRTPDGARLEGRPGCASDSPLEARFDVSVPLKINLDLRSESGNITIEKLDGSVRAVTMGGDIRAGDVLGPISVRTAGGTIDLGNIGKGVEAHSAGGNVRVGNVNGSATLETQGGVIIAGVVNGPMTAETAGGDIVLEAASGPVTVETAGGQIHLGQCGNSVHAQTAGGNIRVAGSRGLVKVESMGGNITLLKAMGPVSAQTLAGRILAQIAASRGTFGPSRLETQVGDVDVFVPPALPVTIDASILHPMGHRIISDFPFTGVSPRPAPRPAFDFRQQHAEILLHGGGSPLNIQTLTGSIQIRKLDAASIARLKASQDAFWKNWSDMQNTEIQMQEVQRAIEQQRREIERQVQELNRELMQQVREQVEHLGGDNQ
ncbi:MAG: hypothetical protein ACRD3D_17555 [Terriglobia bacterium]